MVVVGGHAWQGACMAGGGAWGACMEGGHVWQGACMAGGVHGKHAPPTDTTRYGDMVNERAVRILLECIFVYYIFTITYMVSLLSKFPHGD